MIGPLSFEPWNCTTHRHGQSMSIARGYNTHILGTTVLIDSDQLNILNWVINELRSWKKWCSPAQGLKRLSSCWYHLEKKLSTWTIFKATTIFTVQRRTPSHIWWAMCARHLTKHCENVKGRREASQPGRTEDLGRPNPGLRMRVSVGWSGRYGWRECGWPVAGWAWWSISEGLANLA